MQKQLRKNTVWLRMKRMWPLYLMTVPFVICVLLFTYAPLWGWSIAFVDYFPGRSIFQQRFVGFRYFERMFNDHYFYQALRNTLICSSLALVTYVFPMILAILLNEMRSEKSKRFIQTCTSFPHFISWILVFSIFTTLFSVDDGLINQIFYKQLGWMKAPSNLLANPDIAWYLNTLVLAVWKGCGYSAIVYIAAIAGIDQNLYEAAAIDGAGRFRMIWHVTLPGLMPTFIILFVMGLANILNTGFDQYYVFVNPLTFSKLDNLDTYIFRVGLQQTNFSYATALGIVRSVVSVLLICLVNAVSFKVRGRKVI